MTQHSADKAFSFLFEITTEIDFVRARSGDVSFPAEPAYDEARAALQMLQDLREHLKRVVPRAEHRSAMIEGTVLTYDRARAMAVARLDTGESVLFSGTAYHCDRGSSKHPGPGTRVRVVFTEDAKVLAVFQAKG